MPAGLEPPDREVRAVPRGRRIVPAIAALATVLLVCACGQTPVVHPSPTKNMLPATTVYNPNLLPPAKVATKAGTCAQPVTVNTDGSIYPLLCGKGKVNRLAWNYLAPSNGGLFTLGTTTTQAAVCGIVAKISEGSVPREADAYDIADAYYSWNFPGINAADPCSIS